MTAVDSHKLTVNTAEQFYFCNGTAPFNMLYFNMGSKKSINSEQIAVGLFICGIQCPPLSKIFWTLRVQIKVPFSCCCYTGLTG